MNKSKKAATLSFR